MARQEPSIDHHPPETDYLRRWNLRGDGPAIVTPSNFLRPVTTRDRPAMLKIMRRPDPQAQPAAMLDYFAGEGCVALLEADSRALLMERAVEGESLRTMADDDQATVIICDVVKQLHRRRPSAPRLPIADLESRFLALFKAADEHGGPDAEVLKHGACAARRLLATAREPQVLHGDLHHGNVVHDRTRGWLAIDPKGLLGEPAYEFANVLCNPCESPARVLSRARMETQARLIATRLDIGFSRLIAFTAAHAALAAAWELEDQGEPEFWLTACGVANSIRSPCGPVD